MDQGHHACPAADLAEGRLILPWQDAHYARMGLAVMIIIIRTSIAGTSGRGRRESIHIRIGSYSVCCAEHGQGVTAKSAGCLCGPFASLRSAAIVGGSAFPQSSRNAARLRRGVQDMPGTIKELS